MELIVKIAGIATMAFSLLYIYNVIYMLVPFFKKHKQHRNTVIHNIAVIIAARNEENVICNLIDSVKSQDYPAENITVFVVADNCSDSTASVARAHGAVCYERFNKEKVGKGYALQHLLNALRADYGKDKFDAYLVLDADNVLEPNYITEMNKTFSDGHKIITSYRNSKNFGDNWISAGYGVQFMRESQYLNNSRMLLNTSCAVSGTGFMFSREICEKFNGWDCFTLTEDIEFTVRNVIDGEKIAYCPTAMLYDEQPEEFSQAWKQRMRWAKGFFQVWKKYKKGLIKNIFTKKFTSCADMALVVMASVVTVVGFFLILGLILVMLLTDYDTLSYIASLLEMLGGTYVLLFIMGLFVTVSEWKRIHCKGYKKILYMFTFPIFAISYIPLTLQAFFQKVEWTPIKHTKAYTVSEIHGDMEDKTSIP